MDAIVYVTGRLVDTLFIIIYFHRVIVPVLFYEQSVAIPSELSKVDTPHFKNWTVSCCRVVVEFEELTGVDIVTTKLVYTTINPSAYASSYMCDFYIYIIELLRKPYPTGWPN